MAISCEHGNEPLNYLKGKEFLDKLNQCQFHKRELAPWI